MPSTRSRTSPVCQRRFGGQQQRAGTVVDAEELPAVMVYPPRIAVTQRVRQRRIGPRCSSPPAASSRQPWLAAISSGAILPPAIASQPSVATNAYASWSARASVLAREFSAVCAMESTHGAHASADLRSASRGSCPRVSAPRNAASALASTYGAPTCSRRPAINSSASPTRSRAACRPPRARCAEPVTVTPALTAAAASSAAMRATLRLSSPAWFAQPSITSSIAAGSTRMRASSCRSAARRGRRADAGQSARKRRRACGCRRRDRPAAVHGRREAGCSREDIARWRWPPRAVRQTSACVPRRSGVVRMLAFSAATMRPSRSCTGTASEHRPSSSSCST